MVEGLLGFLKSPEGQGLLSTGAGYLANASRTTPVNSVGRGMLTGLLGYGQALDRQDRSTQEAQERQIRAMQLQKAQEEMSQSAQIRAAAQKAYTPATPSAGGLLDSALPPEYQTGAVPVPARPAAFDTKGFLGQVMSIDPIKGMDWQTKLKPENPLGKIDPKDYTQASLAKFLASGNAAELEPVRQMQVAPNGQVYNPYGVQPGTVFKDPNKAFGLGANGEAVPNVPYQRFEIDKAGAGAARVNVNADRSYYGNMAEAVAKADAAAIEAGRAAPERVANARRIKEILQQNPITGTGAEARLAFTKALATAGLVDGENVANTEVLASMLAGQALDAIKTSGLGGGNGFSNADRDFLERARAGKIDMTNQSLMRLADLNERAGMGAIKRGNSIISKLRMSPKSGEMGQMLDAIEEPKAVMPPKAASASGGGAADWVWKDGQLVKGR